MASDGAKSHPSKFTSCNPIRLAYEDPQEFEDVLAGYMTFFRPANVVEQHLVEDMFASPWRIRRLKAVKRALIDQEMIRPTQGSRAIARVSGCKSRLQRVYNDAFKLLMSMRKEPAAPASRRQPIPWP
jgi:hypothetical protein